jgi:hypothetical protein
MSLASVLLAFAPAIAARLKPREKGERERELEAEVKSLNARLEHTIAALEHAARRGDAWRDRYLDLSRERRAGQAMQQMAQVAQVAQAAQYSQLQQNLVAMQNQQAQAQGLHNYPGLHNYQQGLAQQALLDHCSCTPSRANGLYGALRDDGL